MDIQKTHLAMRQKSTRKPAAALLHAVTAPQRREVRPAISNDLGARKARKLLRATYRNLKHQGGWRAVAGRFGLNGPAQAMLMARGERPVCDRMRDAVRMNGKRFFRGFVKRVAVPFLDKRQTRSKRGLYSAGGRVVR